MEIPAFDATLAIGQSLPVPAWPVTVLRPLATFGDAMRLTPGVPGTPSWEVAVVVLTGRRSVRAIARNMFGASGLKNLQNFATGRVGTSRTVTQIAKITGFSLSDIRSVAEACADTGSDLQGSALGRLLLTIEGALLRLSSAAHRLPVRCPCCGRDPRPTSAHWWSNQACRLGEPEHQLVDRILLVAIAADALSPMSAGSGPDLQQLAAPDAHPFGNWLRALGAALRSPSFAYLAERAGAHSVTPDSVWRYTRGEMLSGGAVDDLLHNVDGSSGLRTGARYARALALAIDLVMAADQNEPPDSQEALRVVSSRVSQLRAEISLALQGLAAGAINSIECTAKGAAPATSESVRARREAASACPQQRSDGA